MVRFDLFLHLRFDLLEVFGRDAMRQFDIVIEAILHRWAGGELRFGPEFQNGRRQDMRRRMTETFYIRHLCALLESFSFVRHANKRFLGPSRTGKSLGTTNAQSSARRQRREKISPFVQIFGIKRRRASYPSLFCLMRFSAATSI